MRTPNKPPKYAQQGIPLSIKLPVRLHIITKQLKVIMQFMRELCNIPSLFARLELTTRLITINAPVSKHIKMVADISRPMEELFAVPLANM